MAYRAAVNNLLLRRANRPILAIRTKASQASQSAAEAAKDHELWSPKLLKKHVEILPLLVIVLGGIGILTGFIVRNTLTRDDIRIHPRAKFGYEQEENMDRQRKFRVYNQKYGAPEGLKELYEEMKEDK